MDGIKYFICKAKKGCVYCAVYLQNIFQKIVKLWKVKQNSGRREYFRTSICLKILENERVIFRSNKLHCLSIKDSNKFKVFQIKKVGPEPMSLSFLNSYNRAASVFAANWCLPLSLRVNKFKASNRWLSGLSSIK